MFLHQFWLAVGPLAGGIIAGLLHTILGPDHLCTIMTLSACQGSEAFWFGVRWAEGHVVGMAIVGCVVTLLNISAGGHAFEAYEHYADYIIGVLLIAFGTYFLCRADRFFDEQWNPSQATCACHAHLTPELKGHSKAKEHALGHSHGHGHGHGDQENGGDQSNHTPAQPTEKTSLIKPKGGVTDEMARRNGSVLVGFVQGLCCPGGLVGILFLKQYTPVEMVVFMCVFFCITILAMGGLAMLYGVLTRRYLTSATVARVVYYASCSMSILFGTLWLTLNLTGHLSILGHDHGGHGHSHGHAHGYGHHDHDHDHAPSDAEFLFLTLAPR